MMHKFLGAALLLVISIGLVCAEEFTAIIKKVDGNKIEVTKLKKGEKGDDATLTVAADVKVVKGKFDKETKKASDGDAIEGGLKNELFTKSEKGVFARITTNDDGKVTNIRVMQFGKKKKDAQ